MDRGRQDVEWSRLPRFSLVATRPRLVGDQLGVCPRIVGLESPAIERTPTHEVAGDEEIPVSSRPVRVDHVESTRVDVHDDRSVGAVPPVGLDNPSLLGGSGALGRVAGSASVDHEVLTAAPAVGRTIQNEVNKVTTVATLVAGVIATIAILDCRRTAGSATIAASADVLADAFVGIPIRLHIWPVRHGIATVSDV